VKFSIKPSDAAAIALFRERYKAEMVCQIVHDSLHGRSGWVQWHEVSYDGRSIGYCASVVAGPWKGTVTFFELYVLPEWRSFLFQIAEAYMTSARVDAVLGQTNDELMRLVIDQYCAQASVEKVLFESGSDTRLPSRGARVSRRADLKDQKIFEHEHEPVGDWLLELQGEIIGTGGYLDHYNYPYVDVFLELRPDKRRQGYGSFFLQELKKLATLDKKVPYGRCCVDDIASRRAMERAGMFPCAHIVTGKLTPRGHIA